MYATQLTAPQRGVVVFFSALSAFAAFLGPIHPAAAHGTVAEIQECGDDTFWEEMDGRLVDLRLLFGQVYQAHSVRMTHDGGGIEQFIVDFKKRGLRQDITSSEALIGRSHLAAIEELLDTNPGLVDSALESHFRETIAAIDSELQMLLGLIGASKRLDPRLTGDHRWVGQVHSDHRASFVITVDHKSLGRKSERTRGRFLMT
jgi:hypothetical protein